MAFRSTAGVRISAVPICIWCRRAKARAERRAPSSQMGWPLGASAVWGRARPSASATTCAVAAVPRNWHPPPGEAQARQPTSAAYSNVICLWAKRAPMVCTLPASSPASGSSVTPPGTRTVGSFPAEARAIIMAGRPLSQVAMPNTPLPVGSERIRRRRTMAASLRKGSESIMPVVPWVRPSQGSVQAPAKGTARRVFSSRAASATSRPTSQWPVWKPRAMGRPSSERKPPWVLRIRNSGSSRRSGSQPMPAFWLRPKRLPLGWVSSISAESGNAPCGPGAWVATRSRPGVSDSSTDWNEIFSVKGLPFAHHRNGP